MPYLKNKLFNPLLVLTLLVYRFYRFESIFLARSVAWQRANPGIRVFGLNLLPKTFLRKSLANFTLVGEFVLSQRFLYLYFLFKSCCKVYLLGVLLNFFEQVMTCFQFFFQLLLALLGSLHLIILQNFSENWVCDKLTG